MDNQGGGLLKTITFMSGLPTAQCFYFLVVIITPRIVPFYVLIKKTNCSTDKEINNDTKIYNTKLITVLPKI